jgi:hypothetical protein
MVERVAVVVLNGAFKLVKGLVAVVVDPRDPAEVVGRYRVLVVGFLHGHEFGLRFRVLRTVEELDGAVDGLRRDGRREQRSERIQYCSSNWHRVLPVGEYVNGAVGA